MNAAALASVASLASRRPDAESTTGSMIGELRGKLLSRDQLADLPPPEPLVTDTLDRSTIALLAGYHGTGKSFIALSWACSVATGHPWLGRPVTPGRVLYVASEGAEGMHARVTAWEHAWGTKVRNLDVLPQPWPIASEQYGNALAYAATAAPYALVVIDTLARCAVGLDENSARDMGQVIDGADRIRRASRSTILLVHHTGKDRTTVRGSSALEAAADTVYAVDADGAAVTLTRTKRKDGPLRDVLPLKLERGSQGSCYVSTGRGPSPDLDGSAGRLMSAYLSTFDATGATKVELRNVAEMPNGSFHRALSALVKAGRLVNEGSDTRPFYRQGGTA